MNLDTLSIKTRPGPGPGDIQAALRDGFGIEGNPVHLDGEHDLNWRIDGHDATYVAKLSREAPEPGLHHFQEALLTHIHHVDPGIRVPVPLAGQNGDTTLPITIDGERWRLRVFSFVPGKPLRHTARSPEQLEGVGRFMGRLSNAMQGFGHPAAHRAGFLWNLDNAEACIELLDCIEPDDERAMVTRVLERWRRHVKPVLPSLPAAVVHHDANDDNLLVD